MKSWIDFFAALISFLITYTLSWAVTVGFVWLVFKLFDIVFTLKIATGIWLIVIFIEIIILGNNNKSGGAPA